MRSMARIDSKGRVLIPSGLRKKMGISKDTELAILHSGGDNHLKVMPLSAGRMVRCSVSLNNSPGSLSSMMDMLELMNVSVLMSESRNFSGNGTSEWSFILDVSRLGNGGAKKDLEGRLSALDCIKSVTCF